jgi:hypothetical protein
VNNGRDLPLLSAFIGVHRRFHSFSRCSLWLMWGPFVAEMLGRTKSWLAWLAGAVLALVFGGAGCGKSQPPVAKYGPPPAPPAGKPDKLTTRLEESKEWRQLVAAWAEAERLLARQWDGKKEVKVEADPKTGILVGIEVAKVSVGTLRGADQLSAAEADFLTQGLSQLAARVRDWGLSPTMCYVLMQFSMERDSAKRLSERLPLIEKLAAQGRISPVVADKVRSSAKLLGIDDDLAKLKPAETWKTMPADERKQIVETRDATKVQMDKLRKLLDAGKTEGK